MTHYASRLPGLLLVVLMAGVVVACGGQEPQIGEPAPDLNLPDVNGRRVSLGDLRGQVVLLNFWATWCEPCKQEMPLFQSLLDSYGPSGLSVVLVALGDDPADVAAYMREHRYSFVSLVDGEGVVERTYRTNTLPSTFLIDGQGILKDRWVGQVKGEENLVNSFLALLPRQPSPQLGPIAASTSMPTTSVLPIVSRVPTQIPTGIDSQEASSTPLPVASATRTPTSPSPRPSPTLAPATMPVHTPTLSVPRPSSTATPAPTQEKYPAPVLISPEDEALFLPGTYAELRWSWRGELAEDEYFDVRLWQEGGLHNGVAWTKEPVYQVRRDPDTVYYWAVAVIRGRNGQMLEQLSLESEARRLAWFVPTPTPSPIPSAEPVYGLTLQCGQSSKTAPAGQLVVFDAQLTNTGTVQDTLWVSMGTALPGGWQGMFCIGDQCYTGGSQPVTLPSGGTQTVLIKIKSEIGAPSGQGGSVTLAASSQGDPSKSASTTATLTVQ